MYVSDAIKKNLTQAGCGQSSVYNNNVADVPRSKEAPRTKS